MKIKRPISAVLILALLLSCICIFASAESESYTGVYNGYSYYTSASVSKTKMQAYLSHADSSANLKIQGLYVYKDSQGKSHNDSFIATAKTSAIGTKLPGDLAEYVSLTATYFINGTNIQRIHVGV